MICGCTYHANCIYKFLVDDNERCPTCSEEIEMGSTLVARVNPHVFVRGLDLIDMSEHPRVSMIIISRVLSVRQIEAERGCTCGEDCGCDVLRWSPTASEVLLKDQTANFVFRSTIYSHRSRSLLIKMHELTYKKLRLVLDDIELEEKLPYLIPSESGSILEISPLVTIPHEHGVADITVKVLFHRVTKDEKAAYMMRLIVTNFTHLRDVRVIELEGVRALIDLE